MLDLHATALECHPKTTVLPVYLPCYGFDRLNVVYVTTDRLAPIDGPATCIRRLNLRKC